jgi:hypothetical protein
MSIQQFEIPIAPQPPKSIRISLAAELLAEIEKLAVTSGIEPAAVIEHAVAFAFATRKPKRTRTKRATTE